jgi:hypothetical protein
MTTRVSRNTGIELADPVLVLILEPGSSLKLTCPKVPMCAGSAVYYTKYGMRIFSRQSPVFHAVLFVASTTVSVVSGNAEHIPIQPLDRVTTKMARCETANNE